MLDIYLNLIARGLSTGAIYGLTAMGIVLIFQTNNILNWSQGNAGMLITYLAFFLLALQLPYPVVIILAIIAGATMGGLVEKYLIRPVREKSRIGLLMITLGLAMVFEGLAAFIFRPFPRNFPPLLSGPPVKIGPITLGQQDVLVIVVSTLIFTTLFLILYRTKIGIGARGIAEDWYGARVMGVPVFAIYLFIWAFSFALSGLVGILVVPRFALEPHFMLPIQVKAFSAAVLGGMNSVLGAIIGGLLLGVMENIIAFHFPFLKESFSLILVVIVLLFLPTGLLGRKTQRRF